MLFVASNPSDGVTLNLEREVTELQRRFAEAPGDPVSFTFLPGLRAEDLPAELAKHRPDVLHISAHGSAEQLSLSNEAGKKVALSAEALDAFLPPSYPPRLIYLNACDSEVIARQLTRSVSMAIGTTAPITNRAARAGAVAFYERILSGSSVGQAFQVVKHMIEMLQDQQSSSEIHARAGVDPNKEVLHRVPRLIADFRGGDPSSTSGEFPISFGMVGCPANTVQIIFFTDEQRFVGEKENLESDLCIVARGTPVRSVMWADESKSWSVIGDFRVFAVGVTGDGHTFSVASSLGDAIETRYLLGPDKCVPADIAAAITALRNEDRGQLDYLAGRQIRQRREAERGAVRTAGQEIAPGDRGSDPPIEPSV
ncbi:CHAT domain-containing protein [Bradyrhizobium sp. CCBAU 53421]|uniref:CHAT domain-containing protein n=1 Tax=Bradyrhizobium sp. CCBAU 53421 TaxID=1325120 RepID=UPI001FEFCE33|nr:CHAT domain-containing protein [Bradyrhizobium sp. CCBAU 53421]